MNIPETFLVEPYNAYAPKNRKKHWHEIIEEQALFARIIAEQQALQEAQSRTLPPNSPNIASQTVGNMNAGAGGVPPPQFFHPGDDTIDFSATPLLGVAPLTVVFTNLTTTPQFDSYLWSFGDETTSTEANPTHVYQSGSTDGTGYTASLQVTNSVTGIPGGITIKNGYITASIPTVTSLFTYVTSSGPGPVTASFTNGSSTDSQTPPTLIYLWNFGDTNTSPLASPAAHPYANTGSFTASLQVTGSYGIASRYSQSFFVPAPTLISAFTMSLNGTAPGSTATFLNTFNGANGTQYDGNGGISNLTYLWDLGSGSISSPLNVPAPQIYTVAGPYTASLQVTESLYGIKSYSSRSFRLV